MATGNSLAWLKTQALSISKHNLIPLFQDILHGNFGFKKKEGLVAQIWQGSLNSSSLWTFNLRFFDGNYTDQKEVILRVQTFDNQKGMTINQPNA